MPTYDFSMTRNKIIDRALRLCGVVSQGNNPTGEQISEGAEALESLVKFLQADNVNLWTTEDRTQALVAGTVAYNLGTDLLNMEALHFTDSTGLARTVPLVSEAAFATISYPTQTGMPQLAKVDMRAQPVLTVWPVPDVAYTLQYTATRKAADFDTSLGTPEAPQRWYDPLVYLLAANLADEYQRPLPERAYLASKAAAMKNTASKADLDPVDALFFNPI